MHIHQLLVWGWIITCKYATFVQCVTHCSFIWRSILFWNGFAKNNVWNVALHAAKLPWTQSRNNTIWSTPSRVQLSMCLKKSFKFSNPSRWFTTYLYRSNMYIQLPHEGFQTQLVTSPPKSNSFLSVYSSRPTTHSYFNSFNLSSSSIWEKNIWMPTF